MLPVGLQSGDGDGDGGDSVIQVVVGELGLQLGLELGLNSSSVADAMIAVGDGVLGGVALTMVKGDCGGEGGDECIGAGAAPEATATQAGLDQMLGPLARLSRLL